jgi:predicted metalloprotease with PDZ domain
MIHFQISCKNPNSQFIQVGFSFFLPEAKPMVLQLPAWRAGRYQLANYAQNIRGFRILGENDTPVAFEKTSTNRWLAECKHPGNYQVSYEYWAGKMDAGSAWVDDEQVYLNLVNCCFEILGHGEEEIYLRLDLPDFPVQVSTLIRISDSNWKAKDYQMLADSTILAAKKLTHWEYSVGKTQFHTWIHGKISFDPGLFMERLRSFSTRLIQDFGEFPESEYHFIFQLLPYPHYHGVEHRRGTVITFGPTERLMEEDQMEELMGISCHELYHAWNVCRIRPLELLPYDFSKETYTQAGLVLEGVTTYLGDLYLLKSRVYDLPTYLKHFEKILEREAVNFGWKNYTILESSFDLWLDGYAPGIPDRKVNIYTRGALLSICLDILLLKNESSLPEVMRQLWIDFGKPIKGYSMDDFKEAILEKFQDKTEIQQFFHDFVHGNKDLFPFLIFQLSDLGLEVTETETEDWLLHRCGIRTCENQLITQIHPNAKAYAYLMKNDQILSFNFDLDSDHPKLLVNRQGRELSYILEKEASVYFPKFSLSVNAINTITKKWLE